MMRRGKVRGPLTHWATAGVAQSGLSASSKQLCSWSFVLFLASVCLLLKTATYRTCASLEPGVSDASRAAWHTPGSKAVYTGLAAVSLWQWQADGRKHSAIPVAPSAKVDIGKAADTRTTAVALRQA
jgi:hypothetical protein